MINYDDKIIHYSPDQNKFNTKVYNFIPEWKNLILDIWCNIWNLWNALKKNKNAKVFWIDISPKAIQIAKDILDDAKVCDIESEEIPFDQKFDYIILADVLEHLKDPKIVLQTLKSHLSPNWKVIVCVPNIWNINIRFWLMLGNFDYTNDWILDNSHLRFFTKKSINSLIIASWYKIVNQDFIEWFNFVFLRFFKKLKELRYHFSKINTALFAQQFIFVIEPDESAS